MRVALYTSNVPKLWSETIEQHRHAVRDAILDAMPELIEKRGVAAVTMSDLAQAAGIGRATLYKYFPDMRAVLREWHERQVSQHLRLLSEVTSAHSDPAAKFEAVLHNYAFMRAEQPLDDIAMNLHDGDHVAQADRELHALLTDLLAQLAATGDVASDVPPAELATFVLHALSAAPRMPSEAAVGRLVATTMAGLRRSSGAGPEPRGEHVRSAHPHKA
jgi:AcrR family transcriptional regulator